jgi:hypothetical protein
MDYPALKTYILSDLILAAFAADGADESIAQAMNSRVAPTYVATEVGVGAILETIGLTAGNALLDAVKMAPDFRHVWPLIEQGRLRLDSPVTLAALDQLVTATVISQANADALKAVASESKPLFGQTISHNDVAIALRG